MAILAIWVALALALPLLVVRASEASAYGNLATWYALWGATTSSGNVLDANDWTAAHKTLPFGTKIKVCYKYGCARGVVITDRGPYGPGRVLDLNLPVANRIGLTSDGVGAVEWYVTGYDPNYMSK